MVSFLPNARDAKAEMQGIPPLVTLLLTTHNRAPYLGKAISSILAQTYSDFELILWDDGSTDNSPDIAQQFASQDPRIRLFTAPHSGRAASLQSAHTWGSEGWVECGFLEWWNFA